MSCVFHHNKESKYADCCSLFRMGGLRPGLVVLLNIYSHAIIDSFRLVCFEVWVKWIHRHL